MKRFFGFLVLAAFAVLAALCISNPSKAAQVMGFTKAAAIASGDTVVIYKKTASGVFDLQVADPSIFALTSLSGVVSVAKGGTGATNAAAARAALGLPEMLTNAPAGLKVALGIQAGSATTSDDNTVTNTFATAFSSAPTVVVMQTGNACTVTNALTITASNFVYGAGAPAIAVKWIAVGAP